MQQLRVALLNAAMNGDGAWANFSRDVPGQLTNYDAVSGTLPVHDEVDAAIVTGSSASAYWDEDWIESLSDWLRVADDRGMPLLGVCFGHQILARALGGEVADMGEYELGYHEVSMTADSPLFDGFDPAFVVFCTHHDEVTRLPLGAEANAETPAALQGFRRGNSFGVQFHPEFDRETAESVIADKDVDDETLARANATVTDENVLAAAKAKRLFGNFLDYAAATSGEDRPAASDD